NPKAAPVSTITLQPPGDDPAWQARAYLNGLDQLCITGGPRDPRKDPYAKGTEKHPNNAPQNGTMCSDSDSIAQTLLDPTRPGASFATSSELDGSLQGHSCRVSHRSGRCIPVKTDPPTHLLVYGIRSAGAPAPVVRWYSRSGTPGAPIAMQASAQHLHMAVDKSPDGLDASERALVATFPDRLDLVLWAARVPIPHGITWPQVLFSDDFPGGVGDDATIEMIGSVDMGRLIQRVEKSGWKYRRGISRDDPPVVTLSAAAHRWVGAFARARSTADAVPERLHTDWAVRDRFGFAVSRKLHVVGGGLPDMWIAPGGWPEDTGRTEAERTDQVCLLGSPLITQCKAGLRRWKRPLVEAVSCAQPGRGFPMPLPGGTLVWALTPPGAKRVELQGPGGRNEILPAGDLLAVRRPVDARVTRIVWIDGDGARTGVKVPWPKTGPRCGRNAPGDQVIRKDNAGTYEVSGWRPRSKH
ncbi:MAG: hypothetical protein AAGC46_03380, partial [Solirubrobacteraceae bacterium]